MSKNEELNKRLQEMKKTSSDKNLAPSMIGGIVNQEAEKTDFAKIAEELSKRKEKETVGHNDNHVKATIYIEADIYRAFEALCVKRGDRKHHINKALAEYVEREYKKLSKQK